MPASSRGLHTPPFTTEIRATRQGFIRGRRRAQRLVRRLGRQEWACSWSNDVDRYTAPLPDRCRTLNLGDLAMPTVPEAPLRIRWDGTSLTVHHVLTPAGPNPTAVVYMFQPLTGRRRALRQAWGGVSNDKSNAIAAATDDELAAWEATPGWHTALFGPWHPASARRYVDTHAALRPFTPSQLAELTHRRTEVLALADGWDGTLTELFAVTLAIHAT